jgi:hypothetical protein
MEEEGAVKSDSLIKSEELSRSVGMSDNLYRRLPLEFEAIQWSDLPGVHETLAKWTKASGQATRYNNFTGEMLIVTKEGGVGCMPGNWFVKDDEGEVYPVLDRRFRRLYEKVS